MKRFLTLFPSTENIHLTKDVGMIPYCLYKDFGYDSTIACYKNGNYEYLDNEVKGLKIVFIKRIFNVAFLDSLLFLLINAHKYDVLQVYHLSKFQVGLLCFFKLRTSKKGLTYLKLDMRGPVKLNFSGLIRKFYKFLISQIDVISVETKYTYDILNNENILGREVIYAPNGFDGSLKNKIPYANKKKKIITVGRIGAVEKNNEMLLQAFAKFCKYNSEWHLELVGPIEPDFQNYINKYFEENADLRNRVYFSGLLTDRKLLTEKYNEAQIFVLTSRYEGFALVYLEAIRAGCYILSSDLLPAHDITDDGKYGDFFKIDDTEGLVELLLKAIDNPERLRVNCENVQDYALENFSWSVILKTLDKHLSRIK